MKGFLFIILFAIATCKAETNQDTDLFIDIPFKPIKSSVSQ